MGAKNLQVFNREEVGRAAAMSMLKPCCLKPTFLAQGFADIFCRSLGDQCRRKESEGKDRKSRFCEFKDGTL